MTARRLVTYWFVILRSHDGKPVPLVGDNDAGAFALFATAEEARAAARESLLGKAYGWETHKWVE